MNNETGKQLIKSATAVLCVAGICISAVISTNKVADTIKATATSSQVQQGGASYGTDSIPTDSPCSLGALRNSPCFFILDESTFRPPDG